MIVVLLLLVIAVAYANGANDVSKGISTLVGGGLATYRQAIRWGTLWTLAGAMTAIVVSAGLVRTFSTGLFQIQPTDSNRFLLAVSAGIFAWVIFASRTGLPVSTTHALTGAILGAAVAMHGAGGVRWPLLLTTVVLPLALSPAVSAGIAYGLHALGSRRLQAASKYCVCLEQRRLEVVPLGPSQDLATSGGLVVGSEAECAMPSVMARLRVTDAMHWGTSAALSFARGLNDNPKIVALGIAAAGSGPALFLAAGAAMGLGSYVYGLRVTKTLAEKVTKIDRVEGLCASAVASILVLAASFVALPVSTTHVATGAIIGAGLRDGTRAIHWNTVSAVALAWIVTLPAAALIAALAWTVVGLG